MTDQVPWALNPETLDRYFESGVPTTHVLSREPRCELVITPVGSTYELLTPRVGPEPDVSGLQRVSVDSESMPDGMYYRLRIDCRDLRHEAYGVVVAIVQAMREGHSFANATTGALANLRSMLARRTGMSKDQQIGLIGELLLVRHLLEASAEEDVIGWWLGPLAEQHDFAFGGFDLELKTTTGERRTHVIHGLGQLQPNPARPLWLASVQITRAAPGEGVSLPDLVAAVRARLTQKREAFLEHLVGIGWRDGDGDLYPDRYLLRTRPAAYVVDGSFPAVTAARLRVVVPDWEAVSDVNYRVDLTGRDPGDPGEPMSAFLRLEEVDRG